MPCDQLDIVKEKTSEFEGIGAIETEMKSRKDIEQEGWEIAQLAEFLSSTTYNRPKCRMPVILALEKWRHEGLTFKVILGYTVSSRPTWNP